MQRKNAKNVAWNHNLVLRQHLVDEWLSEAEPIVDLQFDSQGAQSSKGVRDDVQGVNIELGEGQSDVHLLNCSGKFEISIVKTQLTCHLFSFLLRVHPKFEIDTHNATH